MVKVPSFAVALAPVLVRIMYLFSAVEAGDLELAKATYKAAVKKLDLAAARGIIHKNAAAHKKSQFTKKLNAMG